MSLTPDEFNEIKSINEREQIAWEEFKPHIKSNFSDSGLIMVWYLPKIIEYIEHIKNELLYYTQRSA